MLAGHCRNFKNATNLDNISLQNKVRSQHKGLPSLTKHRTIGRQPLATTGVIVTITVCCYRFRNFFHTPRRADAARHMRHTNGPVPAKLYSENTPIINHTNWVRSDEHKYKKVSALTILRLIFAEKMIPLGHIRKAFQ